MPRWIRTSKREPCPICEKPDGCLISPDGEAVCCSRVESPVLKGAPFVGGWIHKLGSTIDVKRVAKPKPTPRTPSTEMRRLAIEYSEQIENIDDLAAQLGVTPRSLERLQVGWSGWAWSFPMRNADNMVTGITLRMDTGKKISVTGSIAGVYWPDGVEADSTETLFLPEGPTDTAALLDIGVQAIGRFSNQACGDIIAEIMGKRRRELVVFVADNDSPKQRPDGTTFYPGIDGARRLAQQVKHLAWCVKILMPPRHKDIRQWLNSGKLNREILDVILRGILPE